MGSKDHRHSHPDRHPGQYRRLERRASQNQRLAPGRRFAQARIERVQPGPPVRVVERAQLIARVWGVDYVGATKTLDVHVKRLRSRIEVDPANPTRILTIRGVGYKYAKEP